MPSTVYRLRSVPRVLPFATLVTHLEERRRALVNHFSRLHARIPLRQLPLHRCGESASSGRQLLCGATDAALARLHHRRTTSRTRQLVPVSKTVHCFDCFIALQQLHLKW